MKYVAWLLFLSRTAFAADWFCTEVSLEQKGNSFYSCGIGEAEFEADARTAAFEAAKKEFANICRFTEGCYNGRLDSMTVGRTDCRAAQNGFKCYRLVIFSMGPR